MLATRPIAALLERFNPEPLLKELNYLEGTNLVPQPGAYHNGSWRGVTLFGSAGVLHSAAAPGPTMYPPKPSDVLNEMCSFRQLLGRIPGRLVCARLMSLAPGATIEPHRDAWHSLESGLARLHVAIETNPQVSFVVDGHTLYLPPGELWYVDFALPHSVRNESGCRRVHLVLDVELTPDLVQRLPEAFQPQSTRRVTYATQLRGLTLDERRRYVSRFSIPPCLREYAGGMVATVDASQEGLYLAIEGRPWALLESVTRRSLHVLGTPPGFRLCFSVNRTGGWAPHSFVAKGYVSDRGVETVRLPLSFADGD
jgi:hypothetical protein